MKFYASRRSLTANTDFDSAMASVELGPFETELAAMVALMGYINTQESYHKAALLRDIYEAPHARCWQSEGLQWIIRVV